MHGKWEDCDGLCPGSFMEEYLSQSLSDESGKCINKRRASALERQIRSGSKTMKLDTPSGWSEVAPRCSQDVHEEISNCGPIYDAPPLPTAEDPTPWFRIREYSDGHLQCDFSDNCSKISGRMVCCEDDGKCSDYNGPDPRSTECFYSRGEHVCY